MHVIDFLKQNSPLFFTHSLDLNFLSNQPIAKPVHRSILLAIYSEEAGVTKWQIQPAAPCTSAIITC